jgi:beta-lactam-binding protein with PASTA domain
MARRKLVEAGFLVARDFQAVVQKPNEPIQADRVVDQLPHPGEKWPPGGTITIFIGRETVTG